MEIVSVVPSPLWSVDQRGARLRTRSHHRVATLYSVWGPFDPNHDAAMGIDGEAPRRRIQSRSRHESHRHERNPATSDRHSAVSQLTDSICRIYHPPMWSMPEMSVTFSSLGCECGAIL